MLNLVILPATEPDDTTYGPAPERIEAYPEASVHPIRFSSMVWYNEAVCKATIVQIKALNLSEIILVGFSKSGLGALAHRPRDAPTRDRHHHFRLARRPLPVATVGHRAILRERRGVATGPAATYDTCFPNRHATDAFADIGFRRELPRGNAHIITSPVQNQP